VVFVPADSDPVDACRARAAAADRNQPLHIGADAELSVALQGAFVLPQADLVRVRGVTTADGVYLRLLAETLRARGARLVVNPDPLAAAPGVVAELLLAGAVLESEGPLPESWKHAAGTLRGQPDLVDQAAPSVLVLHEPGTTPIEELDSLRATLDGLQIPFAFVQGSSPAALRERLQGNLALVVPQTTTPWAAEVIRDFSDRTRVVRAADLSSSGLGEGESSLLDFRVDVSGEGLRRVARFRAPGRGLLVHHLISDARFGGGFLEVRGFERGKAVVGCRAELIEPFRGKTRPIGCEPSDGRFEVSVPGFKHWGVVTVQLLPGPPARETTEVVRVTSAATAGTTEGLHRWPELTLLVPEWPAGSVTLAFPEEIKSEDGPLDYAVSPLVPEYTAIEGGVRFEAVNENARVTGVILSEPDGLRATLVVTNLTDSVLREVEALICLKVDPPLPFPHSGHARTFVPQGDEMISLEEVPGEYGSPAYIDLPRFTHPLTALESVDGEWVVGNAWEGSSIVGGNAGTGVCVHSKPRFGNLAPGQAVERKGRIWVGRGSADDLLAAYLADPLEAEPHTIAASAWTRPCGKRRE
jgi:hypothetical protein